MTGISFPVTKNLIKLDDEYTSTSACLHSSVHFLEQQRQLHGTSGPFFLENIFRDWRLMGATVPRLLHMTPFCICKPGVLQVGPWRSTSSCTGMEVSSGGQFFHVATGSVTEEGLVSCLIAGCLFPAPTNWP